MDVTVAAIIEGSDGRLLMVEEKTSAGVQISQSSGHVGAGESLLGAVIREALEESAYDIRVQHLLGIYQWRNPQKNLDCLRIAFSCQVIGHHPVRVVDKNIVKVLWMTPDEIKVTTARHRSPMVLQAVEDCLAGKHYPLEIITHDNAQQ